MTTEETITAVVGKKGLEKVVEDIYGASKGQLRMRFKRWKAKKNIGILYTKIKNIRKVKTILQPEKAVDLLKFYYASKVMVGKEVPHPNTVEHHIVWIELYGIKKDGQVIDLGRTSLGPAYANPNTRFHVEVKEFKAFCALAYCNLHGLWQSCLEQ